MTTNITTTVKLGDPPPGGTEREPYAEVEIDLGGNPVKFTIHRSQVYRDTVNVEVDGDLTGAQPALRINLNDNLVFDSTLEAPALPDDREPDLIPGDAPSAICRYCVRGIRQVDGRWIDPEATGDDSIWREYCGDNDTERAAPHEPNEEKAP